MSTTRNELNNLRTEKQSYNLKEEFYKGTIASLKQEIEVRNYYQLTPVGSRVSAHKIDMT